MPTNVSGGAPVPTTMPARPAPRKVKVPTQPRPRLRLQKKPAPNPLVQRAARRAMSGIYDPSQPLAGTGLRDAATALTDLEIAPQIGALRRTVDLNNQQGTAMQRRLGNYFTTFGRQATAAGNDQQAITDRLNATLAGIGSDAQSVIGAAGQQAQQATQPSAALGLDGGAAAQLAAEQQAAQQLAAQNALGFQSAGAQSGASMEGLTNTMRGVGSLRGMEALRQAANATAQASAEPLAKIAELRGQRGQILTKNIGALRDSERNFRLAQDTLGVNAQGQILDAQQQAADRKLKSRLARLNALTTMRGQDINRMIADQGFRLNLAKFGYEKAVSDYQRAHGLGPYKPAARPKGARAPSLSPGQVNTAWSSIDAAKSAAVDLRAKGLTTQQVRQALTTGSFEAQDADGNPIQLKAPKIPGGGYGTYANTAMDLAEKGYISPANVRALHRSGLKIGRRYRVLRPLPSNVAGPSRPN